MMKGFCYEQRSGDLWVINGDFQLPLGSGFAGYEAGRNNPAMEQVRNVGPLPKGEYAMRLVDHPRFKSPAIQLEQKYGETFGRSAFYIHGGTTSHGCIVIQRTLRVAIASLLAVGYDRLKVIE